MMIRIKKLMLVDPYQMGISFQQPIESSIFKMRQPLPIKELENLDTDMLNIVRNTTMSDHDKILA